MKVDGHEMGTCEGGAGLVGTCTCGDLLDVNWEGGREVCGGWMVN